MDIIEQKGIYNQKLSGFRKGHSTTTLLLKLNDDIPNAIKNGKVTLAILAKVFENSWLQLNTFERTPYHRVLKEAIYYICSEITYQTINSLLKSIRKHPSRYRLTLVFRKEVFLDQYSSTCTREPSPPTGKAIFFMRIIPCSSPLNWLVISGISCRRIRNDCKAYRDMFLWTYFWCPFPYISTKIDNNVIKLSIETELVAPRPLFCEEEMIEVEEKRDEQFKLDFPTEHDLPQPIFQAPN